MKKTKKYNKKSPKGFIKAPQAKNLQLTPLEKYRLQILWNMIESSRKSKIALGIK